MGKALLAVSKTTIENAFTCSGINKEAIDISQLNMKLKDVLNYHDEKKGIQPDLRAHLDPIGEGDEETGFVVGML